MAREIGLKFIVSNDAIDALCECLNTLGGEHYAPSQLLNIYYETSDAWLHGHDMRLRVHGGNDHYEITMKIAGRVTDGLHRRPGHNVALNALELDLTLFPAEVWPDGGLPAELASQVRPLSSTDFYCEKWLVDVDGSQIEMVLDLRETRVGEFAGPICELELELLSGDIHAVLRLTDQPAPQAGLRQGSLGKIARGYHLAQRSVPRELKPTRILKVSAKVSIRQGPETTLELALSQWQYHEELWMCDAEGTKAEVLAAMGLMRHILMLLGDNVPRKANARLCDLLTQSKMTILSDVSAVSTVYSTQTAMAKLALTEQLVIKGWQPFLDTRMQEKIADFFKCFSGTHLSRHTAELETAFTQPLGGQYADQLPCLTRNIDNILMLAGYHDENVTSKWIANWQGLRHAIAANQYTGTERFYNEAIVLEPFWLHSRKR